MRGGGNMFLLRTSLPFLPVSLHSLCWQCLVYSVVRLVLKLNVCVCAYMCMCVLKCAFFFTYRTSACQLVFREPPEWSQVSEKASWRSTSHCKAHASKEREGRFGGEREALFLQCSKAEKERLTVFYGGQEGSPAAGDVG